MITPENYTAFESEIDKSTFLTSLGFSLKNINNILYKGLYTSKVITVPVVGKNDYNDLVIKINNEKHLIYASYLLDMQKNDFVFKEKSLDIKKQTNTKNKKLIDENQISLF